MLVGCGGSWAGEPAGARKPKPEEPEPEEPEPEPEEPEPEPEPSPEPEPEPEPEPSPEPSPSACMHFTDQNSNCWVPSRSLHSWSRSPSARLSIPTLHDSAASLGFGV